jgi:quercetin dioxygenase-like cupin family protein
VEILPKGATVKNPPERFAGDVWFDPIITPQNEEQRMVVSLVRFAPGARTAWHSHSRGQTLHVTQGVALFGSRDGTVHVVHPGETIYTPPGEEHWHAATPDNFMEHLAMFETGGDPALDSWSEHVTDEDYNRR